MSWFYVKKDLNCSACGAPVGEGEKAWAVRKFYYTCEPCGFLRESGQLGNSQGPLEESVAKTLEAFGPEVTGEALAQTALYLARQLDRDEVNPRDIPAFSKEVRQTIAQLMVMFPPEPEDDETDKAQQRRNEALASLADEEWEND